MSFYKIVYTDAKRDCITVVDINLETGPLPVTSEVFISDDLAVSYGAWFAAANDLRFLVPTTQVSGLSCHC